MSESIRPTFAWGTTAERISSTRWLPAPRKRRAGAVQDGQTFGIVISSQQEWQTMRSMRLCQVMATSHCSQCRVSPHC